MQNENSEVELVSEPKVESRFGFQKSSKSLSGSTIKILIIGVVISLATVLWIKTPDRPDHESSGVKTPDSSEIGSNSQMSVDNYSVAQDSNQLKEKNKKQKLKISIRFPGLEKIDRTRLNQIPPGSEVKARLLTGASNGLVRAEILESLKIRGETFVTAGETLIGQGQSTEERLFIRFSQVIHRDGSFETIQAQAADNEDKTVGLKCSKVARYALKYGAAVGLNFIGGMTEVLQDKATVGQQAVAEPSAKNALLNGASRATIEMANDTMTNLRNRPPPINIEAGLAIIVIFEGSTQQ